MEKDEFFARLADVVGSVMYSNQLRVRAAIEACNKEGLSTGPMAEEDPLLVTIVNLTWLTGQTSVSGLLRVASLSEQAWQHFQKKQTPPPAAHEQ